MRVASRPRPPGAGTRLRGRRGRSGPPPRRAVPSATIRPPEMNTTRSQSRSTSTMLWLVTSSAVFSSAQSRARPVRTRRATSGSSEAVGSSRISRRGRCRVALTMPTSVRWPDDSSLPMLVGQVGDAEALEAEVDGRLRMGQTVQPAEQGEELADPEPLREGQVAGREADLGRGLAAGLGQAVTGDLDGAVVGAHDAEQHHQRGGLARPVRARGGRPAPPGGRSGRCRRPPRVRR